MTSSHVVLNSRFHLPGEQRPQAFHHSDQLGQGFNSRMQDWANTVRNVESTPFAVCEERNDSGSKGRVVAFAQELKQVNAQSVKDAGGAHNLLNRHMIHLLY